MSIIALSQTKWKGGGKLCAVGVCGGGHLHHTPLGCS